MLSTRAECIQAIETIAIALGELNDQVVFVGGAVVHLYVNDPGAPVVRPTKDVDVVFEITSIYRMEEIRQKLAERGIHFSSSEKVMCRFRYQDVLLDVLSTKEVGWAPDNPWFKPGFERARYYPLGRVKIRIMPLPYYLASKFVAFRNRSDDPRFSHDFEDIVYILDNRTTLYTDILESARDVSSFLSLEFNAILTDSLLQEAVLAHLEPATQTERYGELVEKLQKIIEGVTRVKRD